MEFDAAKVDSSVSRELSADYWRERAECLEEWVCELLRKNQTLRMDLQLEHSQRQHREGPPPAFSLLSHYPSLPSVWLAFGTTSPKLEMEVGTPSCPRKECAEVRESVIQSTVMHTSSRRASN